MTTPSLLQSLRATTAARFAAVNKKAVEEHAVASDTSFIIKVVKKIFSFSPVLTETCSLSPLNDLEAASDKNVFIRKEYAGTVMGNMHIVREATNLHVWVGTAYRRTKAWHAFYETSYRTIVFQMLGSGYWVITQDMLNRKPGIPRIKIPAVDQYPDAEVLTLQSFVEESV